MCAMPNQPSERDLEQLSAYLDGALPDAERRMLEQRLTDDIQLRAELETLRETVTLLKTAPRLKAPRNFTLDPATMARQRSWWARLTNPAVLMQFSGALGTAAAVILIALAVIGPDQQAPVANNIRPQATALDMADEEESRPPTQTLAVTEPEMPAPDVLPQAQEESAPLAAGASAQDSAAAPTATAARESVEDEQQADAALGMGSQEEAQDAAPAPPVNEPGIAMAPFAAEANDATGAVPGGDEPESAADMPFASSPVAQGTIGAGPAEAAREAPENDDGVPAEESEARAATDTPPPSPTMIETPSPMPPPTKLVPDSEADEADTALDLGILGGVLLLVSGSVFILGRKRADKRA